MKSNPASSEVSNKANPRSAFLAFIVLLIGTTAGVLLAEVAVRILAPQSLVSDIIVSDPNVDYRLRPNARGHMSSPEYSVDIRINSLGFRGREISLAKKPGVARVLFLGDSFTFGHGLQENETLPFLVGQELERKAPGKYEVINGGVYGYSTANELDLFSKYGLPLKPDVVVILLMLHNMATNTTWYSLADDGSLKRKPVSSQYANSRRITQFLPMANWLREHSHLFKFIGLRVLPVLKSGVGQDPNTGSVPSQQKHSADETSPEFYSDRGGRFELTTAILARLAKTARENGVRTILLTLGGRDEFENGKMKPTHLLPHEQLIKAALSSGFSAALALSPLLTEYRGKENLFFPEDRHWTATATGFVAPAVADAIDRTPAGRQS